MSVVDALSTGVSGCSIFSKGPKLILAAGKGFFKMTGVNIPKFGTNTASRMDCSILGAGTVSFFGRQGVSMALDARPEMACGTEATSSFCARSTTFAAACVGTGFWNGGITQAVHPVLRSQ